MQQTYDQTSHDPQLPAVLGLVERDSGNMKRRRSHYSRKRRRPRCAGRPLMSPSRISGWQRPKHTRREPTNTLVPSGGDWNSQADIPSTGSKQSFRSTLMVQSPTRGIAAQTGRVRRISPLSKKESPIIHATLCSPMSPPAPVPGGCTPNSRRASLRRDYGLPTMIWRRSLLRSNIRQVRPAPGEEICSSGISCILHMIHRYLFAVPRISGV